MLTDEQRADLESAHRHLDWVMRHEEAAAVRAALALDDALRTSEHAAANRTTPDATASASQSADAYEVRLDDDGALDEVVGRGTFHLERMGTNHWWLGFGDGPLLHVNLHARGKITASVIDDRSTERAAAPIHAAINAGVVGGTVRAAVSPPDASDRWANARTSVSGTTNEIMEAADALRAQVAREAPIFAAAAQPVVATTPARPAEHQLKTDPAVFQDVWDARKTFEIRKNDRDFAIGDMLILLETVSTGEEMRNGAPLVYTGRRAYREVGYVLRGPIYGLQDGWAILGFAGNARVDDAAAPASLPARLRDMEKRLLIRTNPRTDTDEYYFAEVAHHAAAEIERLTALYAVAPPPREPTQKMLEAVPVYGDDDDTKYIVRGRAYEAWITMYDAWMQEGRR